MRERMALLGGRLEIESGRTGTSIVAEVPLS
jgi:signal transduction histidine kinase